MIFISGYVIVGQLTQSRNTSKAAEANTTTYGCYGYGINTTFGSCNLATNSAFPLIAADIPNLVSQYTINGITCTPNPAEVNTTVSCTGTLNSTRVAPQGILAIGIEGLPLANCTFSLSTFTCPNIAVGNTAGSFKIFGKIGNSTPVDTNVTISVINHLVNYNDLISQNLGAITSPFNEISCNIVYVNQPTTCILTIRSGYIIPADMKFGLGTAPAGQCITSGNILTCAGVPTSSQAGLQPLRVQIGIGQVYDSGKSFNVLALPPVVTPPVNPLTLLKSSINCIPNPVEVNKFINCTGMFASSTLELNVEGNSIVKCTVSDSNTFNCTNIPVGNRVGGFKLFGTIAGGSKEDLGLVINVKAAPSVISTATQPATNTNPSSNATASLPRTGGKELAGLLLMALVIGIVAYLFIKNKNKKL
ncbi:MAG: LPXTG cell wall anchor domain-containing protein [candidate division SR1 bacterium]|nr:LPXTG cell wall anchor domain-containing protein [candidate division SR1 bacterium]